MDEQLERRQWQQRARLMWLSVWADVAIGIAALLWADTLLPPTMPSVLGLSIGTIIGLAFLLLAAPATLALYYFSGGRQAAQTPASRGPVEKL